MHKRKWELVMDGDAGGWLWLVIDVIFVVALGAALAYGVVEWRKRRQNPAAVRRAGDQATRELYHRSGNE